MAEAVQETTQAPAVVTEKPSVPQFGMATQENRATEKVEMQRATAQVYASHQRAIQYPRDEKRCVERIFATCANVNFAADAMYRVPRGSDKVEGLNIKAAKEFARIWGNLEYGTVNHGDYGNMSQFEAYSHDLETNVPFRTSYTVKHQRYTKNGIVELVSDQDIGEVQKARNSKEVRNAILSQIPDYVRDEAIKIIKRTLHQAVQDIPGAWNSIKTKFALMGVSPASLCRFINKPLNKTPDCLDAADIVEFRFLYDAIKNDKSVLDETFPERDKSKIPAQPAKKEEEPSTAQTPPAVTTKPTASGTNTSQKPTSNQANSPASSRSTATSKTSSTSSSTTSKGTPAGETKPPASQSQTATSGSQKPASKPPANQQAKPQSNGANTTNTTKTSQPTPTDSVKPSAKESSEEQSSTPSHTEDTSASTTASEDSGEQLTQEMSGEDMTQETQEQTDFSPTDESEENSMLSEEENQNQSESEEESTQEQEDDSEDLTDELREEDAF
ncbi:MAG: hypothetical protein C0469_07760 [Cyanobacteria bacterium DS2.3.42]|nr:hypothetical protein [Cyanobacteria bacterium DS2.3.42]